MWFYWLTSKTVRNATEICRHVEKILNAQRDLLTDKGQEEVRAALEAIRGAIRQREPKTRINELIASLETVGNRWLKSYPHSSWRENVEVVLVAIAVALAIRTFFLQPFKIPTGSMQPTLFGITHEDFRNQPDVKFPGPVGRFVDYWLRGISYVHVIAKEDGELVQFEPPTTVIPFVQKQRLLVGNQSYTVWFAPEELTRHSGLVRGMTFRRGEDIMKLKIVTGDHLFVDRLSYNFRRPQRGEIIVFETAGIPEVDRNRNGIPADQFYIKRLVGLGGETISIGADRHVRINGNELNASTSHFENIYSFDPKDDVRDRQYYVGHGLFDSPGARLSSPNQEFQIRPRHYVVMGDNTRNSLDSRAWGDFPQEYVIGKSFFVYWPILGKHPKEPGRFGWSVR